MGTLEHWYHHCKHYLKADFLKMLAFLTRPACAWTLIHVCLCDPKDCSPPRSSVHGIFQARIVEWGAISSSQSRDWNPVCCIAGGFFTT